MIQTLPFFFQNVNLDSKTKHRHTPNEIKTQVGVTYKPGKKVNFGVHLSREENGPFRVDANAYLLYPGREMRFQVFEIIPQPEKYFISFIPWADKGPINYKFTIILEIEIPPNLEERAP